MVNLFTTETPDSFSSDSPVSLGTAFTVDANTYKATGARYYKYNTAYDGNTMRVALYNGSTGALIASGSRVQSAGDAIGWIPVDFATPLTLSSAATYVVAYYSPGVGYTVGGGLLTTAINHAPFHTLAQGGRFNYGSSFDYPAGPSNSSYFADIVAEPIGPTVAVPPATGSASVRVPSIFRGVVDAPRAVGSALAVEPVITTSRTITGGGPATATVVVRPPASARERATIRYVTDDGSPATLLGWWDGFTIQPLAGWGWWTGSDVRTVD